MDTKLTLRLDQTAITQAKKYAVINQTSLSVLVEKFFKSLNTKPEKISDLAPFVRELSGTVDGQVPAD